MHRSRSFELNTYFIVFFWVLPDNSENKKPNWYVHTAIDPSKVCTLLSCASLQAPTPRSLANPSAVPKPKKPTLKARERGRGRAGEGEREREVCERK